MERIVQRVPQADVDYIIGVLALDGFTNIVERKDNGDGTWDITADQPAPGGATAAAGTGSTGAGSGATGAGTTGAPTTGGTGGGGATDAGGAIAGAGGDGPSFNGAGLDLLRHWEGCILSAYDDANDRIVRPGETIRGTLTIGYGHTGPDVYPGLTWTKDVAEQVLEGDVSIFARHVASLVSMKLNDNQFSAFVCFAFNIGITGFAGSSALHLANEGRLADVPDRIALWDKASVGGQPVVSPGLANRRAAEIALWNKV